MVREILTLRGYARLKAAVEAAESAGDSPPPGWEMVWQIRAYLDGDSEPYYGGGDMGIERELADMTMASEG